MISSFPPPSSAASVVVKQISTLSSQSQRLNCTERKPFFKFISEEYAKFLFNIVQRFQKQKSENQRRVIRRMFFSVKQRCVLHGISPRKARIIWHTVQRFLRFFGRYGNRFSLTLHEKSGKFIKINAVMKPSKRNHPSSRELPFGARQQEGLRRIPF